MSDLPPTEPQLGLFGERDKPLPMHVVSAHTRLLADGSEVFVGEHLRWNRGRQETHRVGRAAPVSTRGQLGLFGPRDR